MTGADQAPWVDGLTLPQVLAATGDLVPGREAVVFPRLNLRWTWAEFQAEVNRVACGLVGLGVRPGDHVGVWSTNWPQWILLQFATASVGAVLVNVNPAYRPHELNYILDQADISVLFLTDCFKGSNYVEMVVSVLGDEAGGAGPLAVKRFPKLRHVVNIKESECPSWMLRWNDFLSRGSAEDMPEVRRRSAAARPGGAVNMQYTSGTTGSPKGAMLSHRNLLLNAYHVGGRMHFSEQDRLCIPVPFYHCFGCVMGTLMCAVYGAAMVIPAEHFDPEWTLSAVAGERCTGLYGVPTMFNAELHHPDFGKFDCSSLRTGIMAGSPCPIELMRQVTTRMHLPEITIAYGLTEASPVITQTGTDEPLEVRVTTVGRELPGLEVRLVDPQTGRDVADGGQGELWVRGHGVMAGYYRKPAETVAAIVEGGWLRSGDLATRTASGHYRITGRLKDMIIRGGENIYPREVEEFLLTHPGIRDAQVVGVPDAHFGEQVSAWIVVKEGKTVSAEEVRDFCRKNVAHYKVPHYVEFVQEYPLTVSGKVQKFKLRELAVQKHGLEVASSMKTA